MSRYAHRRRTRPRRMPRLDRLEQRTAPAVGSIRGTLWDDANANKVRDAGEAPLAGRTVYVDLDRDGRLDATEPSTVTAADGSYSFTNLAPGPYHVAQVLPAGWQQTAPGDYPTRSVLLQSPSQANVFTFNELGTTADYDLPGAYSSAGYTFDTTAENVTKFRVYGSTDTARYAGSPALTIANWPTTISLRRDDGAPFTLTSMDLAETWSSVYTPTVTFVGTKSDGRTVQQAFTLDNVFNNTNAFQTFTFTGFDDVVSVDWFTHDPNDAHQFDNVRVQAGGVLDATGIDLGSRAQATPGMTARDYSVFEQQGGEYFVSLTVDLQTANTLPINVYYSTEGGGTATPGSDYQPRSGRIVFEPGETSKYVSIRTFPDAVPEPDETIRVDLWGAVNATLLDNQSVITLYNDDFVATGDSYTTSQSAPLDVAAPGLLGNDANTSPVSAAIYTGPQHGTVTVNLDGSFHYVPATGYSGPDSFTYQVERTITGLFGTTSAFTAYGPTATVSLSVQPSSNAPPVANNDAYAIDEDRVLNVPAPGVLANDSDPEGATLTVIPQAGPSHGALQLGTGGSFIYVPNSNYNGTDAFTYIVSDGTAVSAPATVTITIRPVNDAPVAVADTYTVDEDTTLNAVSDAGPLPAFRLNFDEASSGTTPANNTGSATAPAATFTGGATRTAQTPYGTPLGALDLTGGASGGSVTTGGDVQAIDGAGAMTVTFWLNMRDVPRDTDFVLGDQPASFNTPGWSVRVADPWEDSNPLTADHFNLTFGVTDAINGVWQTQGVSVPVWGHGGDWVFVAWTFNNSDGQSYTAVADETTAVSGFNSSTIFAARLRDNTALFTIGSDPSYPNLDTTPPAWIDDVRVYTAALDPTTLEAVRRAGQPASVLDNDRDPDGDPLTAALVSGPSHGALTLNADGTFTYVPAPNFHGTDSFTYRALDAVSASAPTTVTITVLPVNDAPAAVADAYTINEDSTLSVSASGVLGNDSDVDGDSLTSLLGTGPAHGALTLNADGSFTYVPAAGFNGVDTFTYSAYDGTSASAAATVTITVNNVAPSLPTVAGAQTGVRGQLRRITVSASDTPADAAAGLTYSINWGDASPVSSVSGAGAVEAGHIYTATGTYAVSVTAGDRDGATGPAASWTIVVRDVELQANPARPGSWTLAVGGTTGSDKIDLAIPRRSSQVEVTINGVSRGRFDPAAFDRILVFGQAGNDSISVSGGVTEPAALVGGAGADSITGGGGDDLLIGGDGADTLNASSSAEDIVIAGWTTYDADDRALLAILDEWSSSRAFDVRRQNLTDGTGSATRLNGSVFLVAGTTVFDDLATDVLNVNSRLDWWFYDPARDRVSISKKK